MKRLTCFKAYDIRGKLGEELDEGIAYRIGCAYGKFLQPKIVVVGGDVRLTSEALKISLATGLQDMGVNVIDIGMVGTEEVYFATRHLNADGGIIVTASHNPKNYNGMKLVSRDARPISSDSGLDAIQDIAEKNYFETVHEEHRGTLQKFDNRDNYVNNLLSFIDVTKLRPLKIVFNAGNGAAGPAIDAIEKKFIALGLPIQFIKIFNTPDGHFPNGIPNPLLLENRAPTRHAVLEHGADMGVAWDGDFDRCFLFDENGDFIEGYYIVGLLAESFLIQSPGEKIIFDPRLTWNSIDIITSGSGIPIMSKTGHAFIKERMRKENAIYGGEMSAHHYFRDFGYCDSGMIPWLLVTELMSKRQQSLSTLVQNRIEKFPSSGEINFRIEDPHSAIERVMRAFENEAISIDHTDGIGLDFGNWRFNLRMSNTEPVVRLNVESRGDIKLMRHKQKQIMEVLHGNCVP